MLTQCFAIVLQPDLRLEEASLPFDTPFNSLLTAFHTVCFPIMIQRLIPRIGFGWSMRVLFFIEIVMLTIAWFTIRTRLPPAIDVRDKSKGGWKQVKWIDMHAFKNPAYTMIVIGFGLVVFGLYTPFVSRGACCDRPKLVS